MAPFVNIYKATVSNFEVCHFIVNVYRFTSIFTFGFKVPIHYYYTQLVHQYFLYRYYVHTSIQPDGTVQNIFETPTHVRSSSNDWEVQYVNLSGHYYSQDLIFHHNSGITVELSITLNRNVVMMRMQILGYTKQNFHQGYHCDATLLVTDVNTHAKPSVLWRVTVSRDASFASHHHIGAAQW